MRTAVQGLVVVLALLPACGTMESMHAKAPASGASGLADFHEGDAASRASSPAQRGGADGGDAPVADARKRVYVGEFTVLAAQRDTAIARFVTESERVGGYVESRTDGVVVVRVPAERFQSIVAMVPALGRVLSESVRTQDVTAEWIDLDVRIRNAEVARERLLALLERATEMKDILAIEEQLRRVTTEIEQMKGQFKALEAQIAYSRITIDFQGQAPPPVRRPTGSRFDWVNAIGIEPALRRF